MQSKIVYALIGSGILFALVALYLARSLRSPSSRAESVVSNSASEHSAEKEHANRIFRQTMAGYILSHDRQTAEQGFQKVVLTDPSYAAAWFNLGVLSEINKRWADSQRNFERYLQIAPNGVDASRAKTQLQIVSQYQSGSISKADLEHEEYDALVQRSRSFLAVNLYREAITEAGRAEAMDKSRWEAYAVVALCMAKQQKAEFVKFRALAVNNAPVPIRQQVDDILSKPPGFYH